MSIQKDIAPEKIREIVESSAVRNTPIALAACLNEAWRNYRSRFLGVRDDRLWIEYAQPEPGLPLPELVPGQKVGVAFKQRHYKFVFTAEIQAIADFMLSSHLKVRGLQIAWPTKMQQLQRRAFYRANVPSDRPVFVDFWEGGQARRPAQVLMDRLVYNGQAIDMSAGGARVRLLSNRDPGLQIGDVVGVDVRISEQETLKLDAQFRHAATDEFGTTLGIQFTGLTESAEGRRVLQRISQLASEFQRIELRRNRAGVSGIF